MIATLPGLKNLDLTMDKGVTDAAMPLLAAMPALQNLNLEATGVTDAGMAALAGNTSLQVLRLGRTALV